MLVLPCLFLHHSLPLLLLRTFWVVPREHLFLVVVCQSHPAPQLDSVNLVTLSVRPLYFYSIFPFLLSFPEVPVVVVVRPRDFCYARAYLMTQVLGIAVQYLVIMQMLVAQQAPCLASPENPSETRPLFRHSLRVAETVDVDRFANLGDTQRYPFCFQRSHY